MESFFAPSIAARVAIHSTWYRSTGRFAGRAWISIDGEEVGDFSDARWWRRHWELATAIREVNRDTDYRDPGGRIAHQKAGEAATETLHRSGVLSRNDFYEALIAYPNLSVEDALESALPLFRALAVLDRRLGKRRLATLELLAEEHPVVTTLLEFRCRCEKVSRKAT
ncbi:MAG: hypothetical protein U0X73_07945 [Thermoanaerobaculia bacterium]